MKEKEELMLIKEEVESLGRKLSELNDDELKIVFGGSSYMRSWTFEKCTFDSNKPEFYGGAIYQSKHSDIETDER